MIDAIVFDLDGTLVDSLDDIAAAMNHVLAERGLPTWGRDAYRRFVGAGVRVLSERVAPPGLDVDAIVAAFCERYFAHLLDHTRAYPGIPELLAELAPRYRLAVLSNKPEPATQAVVRALFPSVPFAVVAGQRPGAARKPDPAGALAIAAALNLAPERCAFVGDSAIDMQTARAAGMRPIAVLWGYRDRDELAAAGAAALVREPAELLDVLSRGEP